MNDVTVEKVRLLEILRANRGSHRETFERALAGWKATAIEQLSKFTEMVRSGTIDLVYVHCPVPEDHTSDYDRSIHMLELHVENTVRLSEKNYRELVEDDWGWKQVWTASNTAYLSRSE